jgi:hypothetical protein
LSTEYRGVAQEDASPADPAQWAGSLSRLHTLAAPSHIDPPVESRLQVLPFESLAWENFERLCLRVASERGGVDHSVDHAPADPTAGRLSAREARLYGVRGQDQQGIDLYVRLGAGSGEPGVEARRYLCVQSRRVAEVKERHLQKAVSDFLAGSWASASKVFVYATSLPAVRRELADAIRIQVARLELEGIEFQVWDAEQLSLWLKERPSLVYDFFGRAWTEVFCGKEAVARLGTRLDATEVAALREKLARFYSVLFDVTDSGMIALRKASPARPGLRERFVIPDVMAAGAPGLGAQLMAGAGSSGASSKGVAGSVGVRDVVAPDAWYRQAQAARYPYSRGMSPAREQATAFYPPRAHAAQEDGVRVKLPGSGMSVRTGADTWLASGDRHVLIGDPGSGKTSFLRFLVLDMLSDAPEMALWARRLGDRLPVWVPFHFFTRRRARYDDAGASLGVTLRAWLDQNDAAHLWPLVEAALSDERLLLVIDGLDEWETESAGHSAMAALESFLGTRELPALASTRPYGLTRLSLAGQWDYASLAVLSPAQQRHLASLWLGGPRPGEPAPGTDPLPDRPGEQAADGFIAEIEAKVELRELAGTPLFLLLLLALRLSGVPLPRRRFEVYQSVVKQLVKDHPATRATAAGVTSARDALPADDVRQVLAHVAFLWQARGDFAPVPEATVRADITAALKDPGHLALDAQAAAGRARPFTEIAEGQLGVLVRYGPRELWFLHRVILEELAAEHAADRLSAADLRDLFSTRASDPQWQQVLLAVLWRTNRPAENSQLVQLVADQARADGPEALTARELLAEAVFGGFRLPATDTGQHAGVILDAIETHPHLAHRQRLLTTCTAGLASPAGVLFRERLPRWVLAPHPMSPGLFYHLGRAASDIDLGEPLWPTLLAGLRLENLEAASGAALALARRYGGTGHAEVRDAVLAVLRESPTADHAALALLCLLHGWPADPATDALTSWARAQEIRAVRTVGLAAVLGVLHRIFPPDNVRAGLPAGVPPMAESEREWLISQLHTREATGNLWRPLLAHTLSAAVRDDTAAWEKTRDDGLEIIGKASRVMGDRALTWAVLMLCRPEDPAVLAAVCDIARSDLGYIQLLGADQLSLAYPEHPLVAQAIEDGLRTSGRGFLDTTLHALAAIDHGPVIRAALLKSLADGFTAHWAADALAAFWPDDAEVNNSIKEALGGEPVRASYVSVTAAKVLGRPAAIRRLLALLAVPRGGHSRIRRDLVAQALTAACTNEAGELEPDAERIAAACLENLDPGDQHEGWTEDETVATLASTRAARDRAAAMLARPQPPLAAIAKGFGSDPHMLRRVLQLLRQSFPSLPAQLRAHLCTLLRESTADRSLLRNLTRGWADDLDDLVASAASAAFHSALHRDQADGRLPPGEWDAALELIRREASRAEYLRTGRQRGAWLGAMLIGEAGILDVLREPNRPESPVRLHLGDMLRPADMVLLTEIADQWPSLRAQFGGRLLDRLTGDSTGAGDRERIGEAWNYLALVAARQPLLSRDLEDAVASHPDMLAHDGILAWYAGTHHGDEHLLGLLISHLDDGTNARTLSSMLLAEPRALGLAPRVVQDQLRSKLAPHRTWYPPYQSGGLEALADGFPDDDAVQECWELVTERRKHGEPADMHPRTYFPVAYAAAPAAGLMELLTRDMAMLAAWGDGYFDPQFARAVIRRLRRDPTARNRLEEFVAGGQASDPAASQFASLLAASSPLSEPLTHALASRYRRQQAEPAPALVHDYVSGTDLPASLVLLQILDPGSRAKP